MKTRTVRRGPTLTLGLTILASFLVTHPVFADDHNSPVALPQHSVVNGKTLQEWSAAWWQWAYAIPVNDNPLFDQTVTGDKSKFGDVGSVFFLGGVYVPAGPPSAGTITVYRSVTIPANKYIFFPIQNANNDNIGYGCVAPSKDPCPGRQSIDQLRQALATAYTVMALHASIDGKPIPNLWSHRETSPAFGYTLQLTDNLVEKAFGYVGNDGAGTVFPAVADGYYLMLAPLPVGHHTINFGGTNTFAGSTTSMDITYYVTVTSQVALQPAVIIP